MNTQFRLGDGVSRESVEDACSELGLRLANVTQRSESHPAQMIYVAPDKRTWLHFIEDEAAGRAIVLRGDRAEELASRMLKALTGRPQAAPFALAGAS